MGVYTHSNDNWLSRRGGFIVLLLAFHVLLVWALKSGFAIKIIESIAPPIKVDIVQEQKPPEEPPPAPVVKAVELPPVSVPPVLVEIQIPVDPPIQVSIEPAPPGPPSPAPAPGPPAQSSGTGTARSAVVIPRAITRAPSPADHYPGGSIRDQEEGKVRVKMCYDTKGVVTSTELDAAAGSSSGKKRLDEAAVKMGKQYRFRPKSIDGTPIAECVVLPVSFSLKDLQ